MRSDTSKRQSIYNMRPNYNKSIHLYLYSLGSDHDGEGRSTGCSAADGYIMAPGLTNDLNAYLFSSCSRTSFKNNLATVT